jgi:hypothetical protein
MAPSLMSRVGMCGRKSFPTKKHMNTAATHGYNTINTHTPKGTPLKQQYAHAKTSPLRNPDLKIYCH